MTSKRKIVRYELIYFRNTHQSDILCHPELFRVNGNTHEERLVNLCVLLTDDYSENKTLHLPSNADASIILEKNQDTAASSTTTYTEALDLNEDIVVGKYYVTLITQGDINTWYIASCENVNPDGTYKMDHLTRAKPGNDAKWKHPPKSDILSLYKASILDCNVEGEWNVTNQRVMTFDLKNYMQIASLVDDIN